MKNFSKSFLFIFFLLFPIFLNAQQQEVIEHFDSQLRIQRDGSMVVTESIKVAARGNEIKHGIYRDFPTQYVDLENKRYFIGFDVLEVKRNGIPEKYTIENIIQGKRVRIGDANILLDFGTYLYEITYVTKNHLGFFNDHDELYWNVTGNNWNFPIRSVSATVSFPTNISEDQIRVNAFSGATGVTTGYYSSHFTLSGRLVFETSQILLPGQGFTIVVGFPTGYVSKPNTLSKGSSFLGSNAGMLLGSFGIFFGLLYFVVIWHRFGRDPKKGTIIPMYDSPRNFSAAQIRYVRRFGNDNKVFVSAIIQLAVDGHIAIQEHEKGIFILEKKQPLGITVSPEQEILLKNLFHDSNSMSIGEKHEARISQTKLELTKYLKRTSGMYFTHNIGYWFVGLAIFVVSLLAYYTFGNQGGSTTTIASSMVFLISAVGLAGIIQGIIARVKNREKGVYSLFYFITLIFFFLVFIFQFLTTSFIAGGIDIMFIVLFGCSIFFIVLFNILMKKPTLEGRKLIDEIEGFKWYLAVAERDRLNFHNSPQKTPELFEKFLPYALALDVDHTWAEQFSGIFTKLQQKGATYYPSWYFGKSYNAFETMNFGKSLSSSLSHALTKSSVRASSGGSGFSGGSSGGGHGGGGGGGW